MGISHVSPFVYTKGEKKETIAQNDILSERYTSIIS